MLSSLVGAVWPVRCAGCGRADVALCPGCRGWRGPPRQVAPPGFAVPVWAVSAYGGPAADLISQWKERGRHDLTRWLAPGLADAVAACLASGPASGRAGLASGRAGLASGRAGLASGRAGLASGRAGAVLVPVPASRAARRRRGSNLVLDLARAAAGELPGVVAVPALRLIRRVRDQAGLGVPGRRENLAGAFAVATPVPVGRLAGRVVVVVDDVLTTGATLDEAVRVLGSEGAQVVGGCCLSVTLRRHGVPSGRGLH